MPFSVEQEILRQLPDQENSRALQRVWHRLQSIVETQQAIAQAGLDQDAVMKIIVERIQNITSATAAVIEMVEGDMMVYRAVSGTANNSLGLRIPLDASLSGKCVKNGEILVCEDSQTDERVNREACHKVGARSMIVVPLKNAGESVGALKVVSPRPHAFEEQDSKTLELMAGFLSNVLAQATEFQAKQRLLTQRTQALEALRESEQRFRNSFVSATIGKALVDLDGRWLEVNGALCDFLGYSSEQLLARTFQDLTYPDDLAHDEALLAQLIEGEIKTYHMEKRYFHQRGHVVWANLSVTLVRDSNREPLYFVSEIQDIGKQKKALEILQKANDKLQNQAFYDALTGVKNRRAFDERLCEEIAGAIRYETEFSLILFDVDQFKGFNDTFGHQAGDEVLREIGQLLRASLRPTDFAARYGGEEFAIILSITGAPGSVVLAERLRRTVAVHKWKHSSVTASFGIATFQNEDAQTLLVRADLALYAAKSAGRNQVQHATLSTEQNDKKRAKFEV